MNSPAKHFDVRRRLARPDPRDEIVISGMSGSFPNCCNVEDYGASIRERVYLCDDDERRFKHRFSDVPKVTGKMIDIEYFDGGFFGIHELQANSKDPTQRVLLERTHEAILDAGIAPDDLSGTKTGVYIANCTYETQLYYMYRHLNTRNNAVLGFSKSIANEYISYFYKLNGPSMTLDSACSSSLYALDAAYMAIREGKCDRAIVGGTAALFSAKHNLVFTRLGVLNVNGECRPFDDNASGYTRSESVVVLILEKAKDAKRVYARVHDCATKLASNEMILSLLKEIYGESRVPLDKIGFFEAHGTATVIGDLEELRAIDNFVKDSCKGKPLLIGSVKSNYVHSKTNVDGFKEGGITFPSNEMILSLLKEVYGESCVPLDKIGFFEAHGTATVIGDLEELRAIDNFVKDSCTRKPLLIGSVKSNAGHAEAVAGLNSVVKVLYAMEHDIILPNINYKTPRRGAVGLIEGRLKVITEVNPWPAEAPYSGINSFGFGGSNGHVILKRNEKCKQEETDKLPRLVCYSGRTNESIKTIQEYLNGQEIDNDFIGLLHSAYKKNIANNGYRGYSVLSHTEESKHSSRYCSEDAKHILLCIGDVIKVDGNTFNELNRLPIFAKTVERFTKILRNNLFDFDPFSTNLKGLEEAMVNTCVQLGIVEILKTLNVVPTHITGYYFGDFVAAYAEQSLTFEEVVVSIYKLRKLFACEDTLKSDVNVRNELQGVIKNLRKKSRRYLGDERNPFQFGTVEYFVHSLRYPNNFGGIKDGIGLRIAGETGSVQLVRCGMKLEEFLENLGRLYEFGIDLNLSKLYPERCWPVQRGTPSISPLIKWHHSKPYTVINCDKKVGCYSSGQRCMEYNLKNLDDSFLRGHVIDGRNLFPAIAYIMCVEKVLAAVLNGMSEEQSVEFTNVKFLKAVAFGKSDVVSLLVIVNNSGSFEVSENGVSVVTGNVRFLEEDVSFELPKYQESDLKLLHKDVYKELRLRGYNYSGLFCGIRELCGNRGILEWSNNFVAFVQNILQLAILPEENRPLLVPTGIERITFNIPGHKRYIKTLKNGEGIPVYLNKHANYIKNEYVEIVGLQSTAITRRKQTLEPILKSHKFIPNETALVLEDALRVNTQIILENSNQTFFKILEYIAEERKPFSQTVQESMDGHPIVLYNINIISNLNIDFGEANVIEETEDNIEQLSGYNVFIGTNLLAEAEKMEMALRTLSSEGFIITLEFKEASVPFEFISVTKYDVSDGIIYLLSKARKVLPSLPAIHITTKDLHWMDVLKNGLQRANDIIIYSENDACSGILGFTNCLRLETKNKIHSFFLYGAPPFDQNSEFYQNQLRKRLGVNVYKNGQWGTYRYMLLESTQLVQTEHSFAKVTQAGDMNSLQWVAGPLTRSTGDVVDIHYSSINFKDLMIASGKLPIAVKNRMEQEYLLGMEYSGINQRGDCVMGIVRGGGIGSLIKPDPEFTWTIPKHWSLEEAATVPIVYSTALLALKKRVNIKRGESILIHSGAGGIGLSAINIALHYGLTVYTTVGSALKRDFLIRNYRELDPLNIGNSRDTSFEQMVLKRTKGRGVNYVLNSLPEEKLAASVRCLCKNGTFLEIGKLFKNRDLEAEFQNKGISFMGVTLDAFANASRNNKTKIKRLLEHGIEKGFVKALPLTCFQMDQLQEAFKYIGTGKHIGKVMIQINRNKLNTASDKVLFSANSRVLFNPEASYIIIGGLGGFGLELVDWMVVRGARNFILVSRNGPKNGYQNYVLRKLKKSGANIKILLNDVQTLSACLNIIKTANQIAPIEGIFNLAVDIRDGLFENLSESDFKVPFCPKAVTSSLLDKLSRTHCPNLRHFVLFSSVTCGMGNAGQTNYGMANSIMERLCESRKSEGYPALTIQWGAIGDVGIVAEMQKEQKEVVIAGTLQQRINSCLEVLDQLLYSQEAVVTSMIVAEKTEKKPANIVDAVLNIIGVADLKTVSPYTTLPELGMDSMMVVQIKNILERDYDEFLPACVIKTLTINKLIDMHSRVGTAE